MVQLQEIELTAADIVILTDLIYEQAPQLWIDGGEWRSPQWLESNSHALGLIQSHYDNARNDEPAADSLAPGESLSQENCAEENYQHYAQFVDGRYSRCGSNL